MEARFLSASPYGEPDIHDCNWYHTFPFHREHPDIVPEYDLEPCLEDFLLPEDMRGKSFLDIGTANGFFSFEMERRGARVTSFDLAIDASPDQIPYPGSPDRTEENRQFIRRFHQGYWYAHRQFQSKAQAVYGSVMRMPEELGQHDVVLLGSILQHLRDPLGALIEADKHTRHTLIVCEAYCRSRQPVIRFLANPGDRNQQYWTWWAFSKKFLVSAVRTLGYRDIEVRGPFSLYHRRRRKKEPTLTVRATR